MTEANINKQAHKESTAQIVSLDGFKELSGITASTPRNEIPEFDRNMIGLGSLEKGIEAVTAQAFFDFNKEYGRRVTQLEMEIDQLQNEHDFLEGQVKGREAELKKLKRYMSAKALREHEKEYLNE